MGITQGVEGGQPLAEGQYSPQSAPPVPPPKDPRTQDPPPPAPPPVQNHDAMQSRILKAQEELEREKKAHNRTLAALEAKENQFQELRAIWKNLHSEFNRFQAQNQSFISLDDDALRGKVAQLRYNIRSFALQNFDTAKLPGSKKIEEIWKSVSHVVNVDLHKFEALLRVPKTRTMLVQSIVWGDATVVVFDRFRWVDEDLRGGLIAMREKFSRPCHCSMTPEEIQTQRKYNMWKANTTSLIVEAMQLTTKEGRKAREDGVTHKAERLSGYLNPFTATRGRKLTEELLRIIVEGLELDLLIYQQGAAIDWLFEGEAGPGFNPDTMEKVEEGGTAIQLAITPGLVKRGKSNGQDFETVNTLLKKQVLCGPVDAVAQPAPDRKDGGLTHRKWFLRKT